MRNMIEGRSEKNRKLHFTLIDPDKQSPEDAGKLAKLAETYGSDAIMIGGSTNTAGLMDETTKAIKKSVRIPTILFPSGSHGVSRFADYIFFMMLMNSTDRRFLVGEQVKAAKFVKKSGLGIIPMGYIVVSTSKKPTAVEVVGKVDRISGEDTEKAVSYATASELFGMHCVYLEAGSGAEKPVPQEMIRAVKKNLDIPLIVGGGIRTPDATRKVVAAGADVVVTGTIAEQNSKILKDIIRAVKE